MTPFRRCRAAPILPLPSSASSASRPIEAHVRTQFVGESTLSRSEQLRRANRVDASEDMALVEAIAHPGDASIALRAADMMDHEAREKPSVADHIRAFFTRSSSPR
jgi:hypothetical protein